MTQRMVKNMYIGNTQSLLPQLIEQFKSKIDNFYTLFIFDQKDDPYDYLSLFQQYTIEGTVVNLNATDTFATSKSYVLSEATYLENEAIFYKLRVQARDHMIEKLAKSIIFYVVAQNDEKNEDILNNQPLLNRALLKTKKIIWQSTFIGESETWETFYEWWHSSLIGQVLEEMFLIMGINGMENLTQDELNALFMQTLSANLSESAAFIAKMTEIIDEYIKKWLRLLIDELNQNIQTYLQIEHVIDDVQRPSPDYDFSKMTAVPNYILVMNNVAYQAVREALYRKSFIVTEEGAWPKYVFVKGKTTGHVQVIPKQEDKKNEAHITDQALRVAEQTVSELSTIDVDVLDILCTLFLNRAKHPEEIIEIELADILKMRGLKAKLGGEGRRGGFEGKQKQQILTALKNIQNLWLTIDKTILYKQSAPVQVGVQGRTFLFKNSCGEEYIVNKQTCSHKISYTVDRVFFKYLQSSQKQLALLPIQALKYHAYRSSCEKQLCRYLSWRWRTQAYQGNYLQPNKVRSVLEAMGERVNERSPM